jgi:hypothetical protein
MARAKSAFRAALISSSASKDLDRADTEVKLAHSLRKVVVCASILCLIFLYIFWRSANAAEDALVRGLWVWKGPAVLEDAHGVEALRDFCRKEGVNAVYVSVSQRGEMMPEAGMARMVGILHAGNIRVEALLSSENADEGGKHLEKLLDHVRTIVEFNQKHPREHFDGIHLDIEPQQRPENKGPGNLKFLQGLVEAYRAVGGIAEPAGLMVNADIQNKLLKGTVEQRKMLMSALPRLTLMMYELSSPTDGDSVDKKKEKVRSASAKFLEMAYDGLGQEHLARMVIGLRTPDYGDSLPEMLKTLDDANRGNPHYAGWSRHSYNDTLPGEH